jgi:hypothetical protein
MDGIMADRDLKNGAIVAKSDHGDVEMQHLSKAAWADPDHRVNCLNNLINLEYKISSDSHILTLSCAFATAIRARTCYA